jgi:D-galactarolactone cycloisomerase
VRRSISNPIHPHPAGKMRVVGRDGFSIANCVRRVKAARRALDIAQPDVARAGGLTEIRRIAALTSAHGVRLAPHAWGSGVLFAASIHVTMAAANCHILEVTQGYMPMMWELFNETFDIRPDGTVHAPEAVGLGFTLRADALERFRYVEGPEYEF